MLPAAPGWSPPRRLAEFLDTGEPVVYIGFGSMPGPDPGRLAAAILAAARQSGVRAVVASPSPELPRPPPAGRFPLVPDAPPGWLFPPGPATHPHPLTSPT